MKRWLSIFAALVVYFAAMTLLVSQTKPHKTPVVPRDSTVIRVSVASEKERLQARLLQVQTQGNAIIQAIQAQLGYLQDVASDSIDVKKGER